MVADGSARTIPIGHGKGHALQLRAGMPCPNCNRAEGHEIPRLPFTPDDESKRH
jgi:hypothetical protein